MAATANRIEAPIGPQSIIAFVTGLLGAVLHMRQAKSTALVVVGAMFAYWRSIAAAGRSLARRMATRPKLGIWQFDRLQSGDKVKLPVTFRATVPWLVADRQEIVASLDWTEYANDEHARLALHLVTNHGQATSLVRNRHEATELNGRRNKFEDKLLILLHDSLPPGVKVTLLADRGFADTKLYHFLHEDLDWHLVIHFRADITVTTPASEKTTPAALVPSNGLIRDAANTKVTNARFHISVVCVKHRGIKDAWCLATTLSREKECIGALYGRRFLVAETFRNEKGPRFRFGLQETPVGSPERHDRFLLVAMLATIKLTLFGAAGEDVGCDHQLKVNTTNRRTHSLVRQARTYLIGCPMGSFAAIRQTFNRLLRDHPHVGTFAPLLCK